MVEEDTKPNGGRRRVSTAEMQRSEITSCLKMRENSLYNENKSIRLMKVAVTLLEEKRKKTSLIVMF